MEAVSEHVSAEKEAPQASTGPGGSAAGMAMDQTVASRPAAHALGTVEISRSANTATRAAVMRRAQQTHGNRFVQGLVATAARVQRACACGGTCDACRAKPVEPDTATMHEEDERRRIQPKLSRAEAGPGGPLEASVPVGSAGEPLDRETRGAMESSFSENFSDVRVHTGAVANQSAETLDAQAFTFGRDIYFGAGRYNPSNREGRHLLAHELAHVIQQRDAAAPSLATAVPVSQPEDPEEIEAERAAGTIAAGNELRGELSSFAHKVQRQGNLDAGPPQQDAAPTPAPADAGTTSTFIWFNGVNLTTDQAENRKQLEQLYIDKGSGDVEDVLSFARREVGKVSAEKTDYNGVTDEYLALAGKEAKLKAVFDAGVAAWAEIKAEIAPFLAEFQTRSEIVIGSMLNLSEERVLKEQAHYGLKTNPKFTTFVGKGGVVTRYDPGYSIAEGPAKTGVAAAAKQLAQKLRKVSRARDEMFRYMKPLGGGFGGVTTELVVSDQQKYDKASQEYKDVQFDYLLLRSDKLTEFPLLAKWATGNASGGTAEIDQAADSLEDIGSGSTAVMASTLNQEVNKNLESIAETRDNLLKHELNIWKIETVVAGTKESMGVAEKTLRARAVAEKVSAETWGETIVKIAIAVLALALGLLAAIPTGGSSLAAGIAVAAAVGGSALSVGLAYSDFKEYMKQSALAGTDFDKAHAISAEEPSLFWLAVSIIGAVIDVGAAIAAFKALGPVARAAREAKRLAALGKASAAELAEGEKVVNQLVKDADGIKSGLGDRLRRNIAEVAGEEARNSERLAAHWEEAVSPETKAFLGAKENESVALLYRDMDPVLRDLLTHCSRICIIPNLTNIEYARIKTVVYKYGAEDLGGLKEFFHFRRNDVGTAIKELEGATSVEELQNAIRRTIQLSPEDAAAEGAALYERLSQAGIKDVTKEKFVENYKAGLRFDEGTRMWYDPVKGIGKDLVPLGLKTEEVLTKLKASPGFGPYAKVLVEEKIVTGEDELVKALESLKPQGKSVDAVRHELKEMFKDKLLARMVDPNKTVMENYKEMRRLTDELAPSDKGNLFEAWYKSVVAPGGVRHLEVSAEELTRLGSEFGVKRFPDLLEGDALHELKRVAGPLGSGDKEQFLDNMRMLGKDVKIGNETRSIKSAVYTFPIPEGARANAGWMRKQLATYPQLSFEVFNNAGERRLISKAADLDKPELWSWLGVTKPGLE